MTLFLGGFGLLAACSEEPPPRSVTEFIKQPIMLEAAMVRCQQNRDATRYDAECVNARQAAHQIEAKTTGARKAELEALSERKRQALRKTMSAVSKARERARENERLRAEEEYDAQFGLVPREDGVTLDDGQLIENRTLAESPDGSEQQPGLVGEVVPASDGGNAPMSVTAPHTEKSQTDLESVREELQRRSDESDD
jgi:hypothetical protein